MIVTKTITAENIFSDPLTIPNLNNTQRKTEFNCSIWLSAGTFSATVTVQRSFDNGVTWLDVATFSAPEENVGQEIESSIKYRIGVKTGDYVSGTIEVRLAVN